MIGSSWGNSNVGGGGRVGVQYCKPILPSGCAVRMAIEPFTIGAGEGFQSAGVWRGGGDPSLNLLPAKNLVGFRAQPYRAGGLTQLHRSSFSTISSFRAQPCRTGALSYLGAPISFDQFQSAALPRRGPESTPCKLLSRLDLIGMFPRMRKKFCIIAQIGPAKCPISEIL